MDSDKMLSTTRSVWLKLDLNRPVEHEVISDCLRLALQAPTPANMQNWRWLVIRDQSEERARRTPDEELAKQSIEDFGRFRTGDELAAFLLGEGIKGARVKSACPVAVYFRGFTEPVRILVGATTKIWSKNLTTVINPQVSDRIHCRLLRGAPSGIFTVVVAHLRPMRGFRETGSLVWVASAAVRRICRHGSEGRRSALQACGRHHRHGHGIRQPVGPRKLS